MPLPMFGYTPHQPAVFCKHIAATLNRLAQQIDGDNAVLFSLRATQLQPPKPMPPTPDQNPARKRKYILVDQPGSESQPIEVDDSEQPAPDSSPLYRCSAHPKAHPAHQVEPIGHKSKMRLMITTNRSCIIITSINCMVVRNKQ